MKYTTIILSIVLISLSYIIYESESVDAMKNPISNWKESPVEIKETKIIANQVLRDSKATSFVPHIFKVSDDFSKIYEVSNRITNHNRSSLNW